MKQLSILLVVFFFLSCSKDDLDCRKDLNDMYSGMLENDDLTPKQRDSITRQWALAMEKPCELSGH